MRPPGSTGPRLGPRADRPYSGKLTPFVCARAWDFGNGTMPDMSPHHFYRPSTRWPGCTPTTIEARQSLRPSRRCRFRCTATSSPIAMPRGRPGPLRCSGRQRPQSGDAAEADPDDARQRLGDGNDGLLLVGDKVYDAAPEYGSGRRACCRWSCTGRGIRPRNPPALASLATTPTGWRPTRHPAWSNFDYGARLTEFVLLGGVVR